MKISGKSLLQTVSGHGLRLLLSLVLLSSVMLPFATAVQASPSPQYPYQYPYQYQNIPTFSIVSVNPNSTVTVQAANFPAGQHFTVRMGLFGTLGINGIVVATTDSGGGGVFQATYTIPDGLKGQPMIAIRMDNDTGYFYSYNWFYNNPTTFATPSGGGPGPVPAGYFTGIPTFTISRVARDSTVVIHAYNFPPNEKFTVQMGYYGTFGINGIVVATTDSGSGGSFEATYTIPDSLKGQNMIAIRMDNATGYYFSYNWFYNFTTTP